MSSDHAAIDEVRALLRFPARDDVLWRHRAGILLIRLASAGAGSVDELGRGTDVAVAREVLEQLL